MVCGGCGKEWTFGRHSTGRRSLLASLDACMARAKSKAERKASGLGSLFEEAEEDEEILYPVIADDPDENLLVQRDLLGVYASGHPLDEHRLYFENIFHVSSELTIDNLELREGGKVTVAGSLEEIDWKLGKTGSRWGMGTLSDLHGSMGIYFWGKTPEKFGHLLTQYSKIVVFGSLKKDNWSRGSGGESMVVEDYADSGPYKLICDKVWLLDDYLEPYLKELHSHEPSWQRWFPHPDGGWIDVCKTADGRQRPLHEAKSISEKIRAIYLAQR